LSKSVSIWRCSNSVVRSVSWSSDEKTLAAGCDDDGTVHPDGKFAPYVRPKNKGAPMAAFVIPTARLDLVLQTPDEVLASIERLPPADRAEVSPDWLARVRVAAAGDPWALSFTIVERAGGVAVGSCAFKGPPDADGIVEVAYGVDKDHRGRGY